MRKPESVALQYQKVFLCTGSESESASNFSVDECVTGVSIQVSSASMSVFNVESDRQYVVSDKRLTSAGSISGNKASQSKEAFTWRQDLVVFQRR